MNRSHFRASCMAYSLLLPLFASAAEPPDPSTLEGSSWHGTTRGPDGASKSIGLSFEHLEHKGKSFTVLYLDVPSMKFRHVGPMPVQAQGDGYAAPVFHFSVTQDNSRITGAWSFDGNELPIDLVPGALTEAAPADPDGGRLATPTWSFKTGGPIWSSPAVDGGTVYFGSNDGNVYALEAATGKLVWQFDAGAAVMDSPALDQSGVYVLAEDGMLYKLSRRDGRPAWKFDTHGEGYVRELPNLTSARYEYQGPMPMLADGTVYVGSADKHLYAIDATSGRERWRFAATDTVRSTPAVAAGAVFFGSFDHYVYAVDAKDGSLRWKYDTLEPVTSSALVADGTVYIGSRDSNLFAFDARSGAVKWKAFYWSSWVESTPRLQDGVLYIGSSDWQQLLALDASSGRMLWSFCTGGAAYPTPALTQHAVFTGAVGIPGYMIHHRGGFFAVDRASGKALWHYPLPALPDGALYGVAGSPAQADGRVFFGGLDGVFYAFHEDGSP